MRVVTFNVNGIRAADRRGFRAWLERADPDVVGLQEVRAPAEAVPPEAITGWHWAYDPGQLAGRNGVALLSKTAPLAVRAGLEGDAEFRHEGRYIEADYQFDAGPVTVASLYLPKGAVPDDGEAEAAKYARKLRFCAALSEHLKTSLERAGRDGRPYTLVGDFNIARTPQDLYNNHSKRPLDGFLPEERAWLTGALELGLVDVVRSLHLDGQGPYSWWSWRGQSWDRDYGWRIDYHLSTPELAARAAAGTTDRPASYQSRVSDHAPVVVDYDRSHGQVPTGQSAAEGQSAAAEGRAAERRAGGDGVPPGGGAETVADSRSDHGRSDHGRTGHGRSNQGRAGQGQSDHGRSDQGRAGHGAADGESGA